MHEENKPKEEVVQDASDMTQDTGETVQEEIAETENLEPGTENQEEPVAEEVVQDASDMTQDTGETVQEETAETENLESGTENQEEPVAEEIVQDTSDTTPDTGETVQEETAETENLEPGTENQEEPVAEEIVQDTGETVQKETAEKENLEPGTENQEEPVAEEIVQDTSDMTQDTGETVQEETAETENLEPGTENQEEPIDEETSETENPDDLGSMTFEEKDITDYSKQIILVTGNDEKMNDTIKEALEKVDLKPILTQSNENISIPMAEKVMKNENVTTAVVILSADDFVYERNSKPNESFTKARQKVVFELGFWMGKLGRERVFAVYYDQKNFRTPTEIFDANYIPFYYINSPWENVLLNRLEGIGVPIDRSQKNNSEFSSMREKMNKPTEEKE